MMTQEELKTVSDDVLLAMVAKAKGHTGNEFKSYMDTNFSYTTLTSELQRRGYSCGWHKVSDNLDKKHNIEVVDLRKTEETIRTSFLIGKNTAARWKSFCEPIQCKTVLLNEALKRFIDDVEVGKVKLEVSFEMKGKL